MDSELEFLQQLSRVTLADLTGGVLASLAVLPSFAPGKSVRRLAKSSVTVQLRVRVAAVGSSLLELNLTWRSTLS